jgi:molybdenum cofactor biosynthesis enzyme MoaA
MERIDLKRLYKLPWKKYDNPNGWLELTTFCQLKCPGCYRGLDKKDPKRINAPLAILKKEVDFMIEKRNVQTISLSGGEPLLYPDLNELVRYISSKKIKTKIYTNGILLSEIKLIELKKMGVTEFVIHIDKFQNRKGYSTEEELNVLRDSFCKLFRKVEGVNLGFIMPISDKNSSEISNILSFYKKNSDIINLIVFTCYNPFVTDNKKNNLKKVSIEKIADEVKKSYCCNPSTYLPKSLDNNLAWLFFYTFISNGNIIGNIDSKQYKFLQNRYRKRTSKYFITIGRKELKKRSYFYFFGLLKTIKLILSKQKVYNQVILIIDSPKKTKNGWNLCSGCPDPVLYRGELVPSCLLERIKKGERIIIK